MFEQVHNYRKSRAWLRQLASPVFLVALAFGIFLHLAGFLVFRVVTSELPTPQEKAPFVNYVTPELMASDPELEEQATLLDSAPLFIPSEWTTTRQLVVLGRDSVGDGFSEFEPQINLDRELKPNGLTEVDAGTVVAPVDLLALRFWNLFAYLGRTDPEPVPFAAAGPSAKIQVLEHGSDRQELNGGEMDVELDMVPAALLVRPMRLLVLVSGAGRVLSGPTMMQSSGDVAFDEAVLDWARRPDVAARLPVGYLEIEVYP